MKNVPLVLTLAGAAALAGCASYRAGMGANTSTVATTTTTTVTRTAPVPARLAAADLQFVAIAAGSGMYEAEAARVASSRANDAQVRGYVQMLLDHHTASNDELMALLSAKGHRVAPGLPPSLQARITTLSGLTGAPFDREFMRTTGVQDHMAAVAAFEEGRRTVADRDLQAYIDKTLPVLRSHLQEAQNISGRLAG